MSDATLARMEHGKYVGVRKESRRDGVCTLRKRTPCAVLGRFFIYVPYAPQLVLKSIVFFNCSRRPDPVKP